MSKWTIALVFVAAVFGPGDRSSSRAAESGSRKPEAKRATAADVFYRPETVQEIQLQVHVDDLARMKEALPRRIYVPATFRWDNQVIENVGVRYKGNSSSNPRQRHKRSFLIKFSKFEKGQTFLGLERVALDNGIQFGSLFSEQLITAVLRDLGIKASRCNFATLTLNGTYHGVYTNVERIDEVFIRNNFADGSGALYKNHVGGAGADLSPIGLSPDPNRRRPLAFEPKSASAHDKARDVLELIASINRTPDKDFARVMESTIEMDAFLRTMAVMLFSGAFDQLTGWGPHNYYLYHDPRSKRWNYLPWDLDVGFADNAFGRIPVIAGWNAAWPMMPRRPSPLVKRIIDNPQLLARYRRLADSILEKYFHPRILLPKVDGLYARVEQDLARDPFPHRRVTNREDRDFSGIITSIKNFVRLRYKTARAQLDAPGDRPRNVRSRPRPPRPGKPSSDAPTELRVVSRTATRVTLGWKDNATGEAGHVVQRANGENGQEFRNHIGRPGGNISTAVDTAVVAGRTYRYRVFAVRPTPSGQQGTGLSKAITVRVPDK
jgi:spore coat protein CotH